MDLLADDNVGGLGVKSCSCFFCLRSGDPRIWGLELLRICTASKFTSESTNSSWIDLATFEYLNFLLFVVYYKIPTSLHFLDRTFIKKENTDEMRFSPTLGGDIFTSVCLHDKNSGATDSGRPEVNYHCDHTRSYVPVRVVKYHVPPSANVVFANIHKYLQVSMHRMHAVSCAVWPLPALQL